MRPSSRALAAWVKSLEDADALDPRLRAFAALCAVSAKMVDESHLEKAYARAGLLRAHLQCMAMFASLTAGRDDHSFAELLAAMNEPEVDPWNLPGLP